MLDQDTKIDGYIMPKGTAIFCQIYPIHRHPDFWENPDVCVSTSIELATVIMDVYFRNLILFDLLLRTPKVIILMPLFPSQLDLGKHPILLTL